MKLQRETRFKKLWASLGRIARSFTQEETGLRGKRSINRWEPRRSYLATRTVRFQVFIFTFYSSISSFRPYSQKAWAKIICDIGTNICHLASRVREQFQEQIFVTELMRFLNCLLTILCWGLLARSWLALTGRTYCLGTDWPVCAVLKEIKRMNIILGLRSEKKSPNGNISEHSSSRR